MLDMSLGSPSTSHNHTSVTTDFAPYGPNSPGDAAIECDCGRLIDDLQTPAQAKILMVYEEDLLAQTSRPVSLA